ncbi:hypothetical protein [Cognatilysobacter lacus]|nr:hypothetical protein [Lysobacter lacus]
MSVTPNVFIPVRGSRSPRSRADVVDVGFAAHNCRSHDRSTTSLIY